MGDYGSLSAAVAVAVSSAGGDVRSLSPPTSGTPGFSTNTTSPSSSSSTAATMASSQNNANNNNGSGGPQQSNSSSGSNNNVGHSAAQQQNGGSNGSPTGEGGRSAASLFYGGSSGDSSVTDGGSDPASMPSSLANGVAGLDSNGGKCVGSKGGDTANVLDAGAVDELCSAVGVAAGLGAANYWSNLDCNDQPSLTAINSMNGTGGLGSGLNGALSPQAIFQRRAITGGGGHSTNSLIGGGSLCSSNGGMGGLGGGVGLGGASSMSPARLGGGGGPSSSNLFGAYSDWSASSVGGPSGQPQSTAWSSGSNGLAWPPQKRLLGNNSAVGSSVGLIKSPSQQPQSAVGQGPKAAHLISPSKFRRSTTLPITTKSGFQSFADFQDHQDLRSSHDIISFQVRKFN